MRSTLVGRAGENPPRSHRKSHKKQSTLSAPICKAPEGKWSTSRVDETMRMNGPG